MNPITSDPAEPGPPLKPRPPDLDWLNRLPLRDALELAPDPTAPKKARRRLAATLEKWSLQHLGISAPLVLSEITTNALNATNAIFGVDPASGEDAPPAPASEALGPRRPGIVPPVAQSPTPVPPVTLWLYGWPAAVAMLAWDASTIPPEPQRAGPGDESGRGLAIIGELSADWGYYYPAGIGGKITWAIVDKP